MRETKKMSGPGLLTHATRYLFFTGKGGVGKTSLSTATALALSDSGKAVLLVSTDAASNLDEMLGVELHNTPTAVTGAPGLSVMNIDPDTAAESYRLRVLDQMDPGASDTERSTVREQLSGACTTEIAAFDEFSALLAGDTGDFDHVIFDTAPTGHTLRLLSLPKAWTGFLEGNDRGASCLGPHSGLKMQETRFQAALRSLADASQTTVVLVTRPDKGTIAEADRTSVGLRALGLGNQRLAINGVFHASDPRDPVARSIEDLGRQALAELPEALIGLPRDEVPLRAFDMVGLPALRTLFDSGTAPPRQGSVQSMPPIRNAPGLDQLADEFAAVGRGLIMVMGKGGVGKTTIAAALAVGLVERGNTVHLSTTDPAAHLAITVAGELPGLRVDRIDPKVETQRYVDKIMAAPSAQSRWAGASVAARGSALSVHRGSRGLSCIFANRQRSAQRVRRARYSSHGTQSAPDGCNGRLPSADDARVRDRRRRASHHPADATAGSRLYADPCRDIARDNAGVSGSRPAAGPASGGDRALRLGDQQEHLRGGHPRPPPRSPSRR